MQITSQDWLTSVPVLQWGMEAAKQGILPVSGKKMKRDLQEHDEHKSNLRKKYLADREKSHSLSLSISDLGHLHLPKPYYYHLMIHHETRSQCDFEYFGCKVLKFTGEVFQVLWFSDHVQGPTPLILNGKNVFLESPREALLQKVSDDGGVIVSTRATADMIVKDNLLLSPGIRNSLSMMLVGGLLVDTSYILKGRGPVIAYKRLMRTPKHVFLSTGFTNEYPGAVQVIQKAVASQGSPKRWHVLSLTGLWDPNSVVALQFQFKYRNCLIEELSYWSSGLLRKKGRSSPMRLLPSSALLGWMNSKMMMRRGRFSVLPIQSCHWNHFVLDTGRQIEERKIYGGDWPNHG